MIKKLTAIALMIITMMCCIGSVAPVSADSGETVNLVQKYNIKCSAPPSTMTVNRNQSVLTIYRINGVYYIGEYFSAPDDDNRGYYFDRLVFMGKSMSGGVIGELSKFTFHFENLSPNYLSADTFTFDNWGGKHYDVSFKYLKFSLNGSVSGLDLSKTTVLRSDYVGYFIIDRSFQHSTVLEEVLEDFANQSGDLDFTSTTTEARFTSLGDYTDVTSNQIKSFFATNAVSKKTSTSDGTRANYNELFGNGSYIETTYYLPTDVSIPSYFIPNKSVTNEVSFRFTNRDVKNLKIVVSKYTNVSDKVTTPDTGIFSFERSMTANYMHQYIAFQPKSFKDIPQNKVLHYKFDLSGLVSLISQNKTYNDYWGGTAYYYDLFSKVIDESYKAEAFVLELYGDDKLLTSATYCYTGSLRFDEPTGEPAVEFILKDKDDGFEPTIDDDSEKIGGFDDSEKDDTVIKNPVGDYDLNFNIDDIGLAVMSSVNSTKSLFTFAWSLFPAAFMTLVLGALGLIVILRVLGR